MGALCISAQARTAPRTTRKRHQRSVCVTAATPSRPQPIETSSNHLSGAGLGHASLPLAPLRASRRRPALRVAAGPAGNGGPGSWGDRKQRKDDQQIILGVGLALTLLVVLALKLGGAAFEDADAWDLGGDVAAFGVGDAAGGLLWAISLWFCSPIQLIKLFVGFVETERPSDWVLQRAGRAAGLDVDAIDYRVPAALQAAAVALFAACGCAVAAAFQALLGDATWSVSTGLGSCMAAAVYEVGRPKRLSVEEALEKEAIWQDFKRFADARLARRGRCHETEVLRALQRELPKYRQPDSGLDGGTLRDLVRNWAPEADRSSQGYYKGVSLQPAGGSSLPPPSTPGSASSTDSADQHWARDGSGVCGGAVVSYTGCCAIGRLVVDQ